MPWKKQKKKPFTVGCDQEGQKSPLLSQMVLRVLLVRHAQSENNIVQASVQHKIKAGVSPQDAQAEWLSKRHDDPDLSPEGGGGG